MSVVVVEPGFLTTVQDLGRPGHAALGVSAAGAADPIALRCGNRLVGNDPGAPALEMTLVGATLRFERATWIATTGATGSADWKARRVGDGETVACGPCRGGARAYLCVRGGIDVPRVLGSASTHLATRLGGFAGRALRAGDRIALPEGEAGVAPLERALDPTLLRRVRHVIRENARVDAFRAAALAGDLARAGALLREGMRSLRDDYAVSVPELDLLCALGDAAPGCHGSRLTGAGFGGCTLHLVEPDASAEVAREIALGFAERFGREPPIWCVRPSDGAQDLVL